MLEDKVVHKLEEGVITVEDNDVIYFNETAFRVFPQLERGISGDFLEQEFPDYKGTKTSGLISFRYKKIPDGDTIHYIFSPPEKQVKQTGLSGQEMVKFLQLVAKESEDICGQAQWMAGTSIEQSRIQVHAHRLRRMADMLHHSLEAIYVEPPRLLNLHDLLEKLGEDCQPLFSRIGVTVEVEQTQLPVMFVSKKTELQRIFFLLFSIYGKKGQEIQLRCAQYVNKVVVTLTATKQEELKGMELYYLEQLLEGLQGKILPQEDNQVGITLKFKVGQLPNQLQSGNHTALIPILAMKGREKVVYLPTFEVFLANCLPEDYFLEKKEEEVSSEDDDKMK